MSTPFAAARHSSSAATRPPTMLSQTRHASSSTYPAESAHPSTAAGQQAPDTKPILEINPEHPLLLKLKSNDQHFDEWTQVLFDQALLAEGGQLNDPAAYVKRINQLLLS